MPAMEHMRKHVVILGAGFGGLAAALELEEFRRVSNQEYNVTLVDKNCYHLYHALLYEVATAAEMVKEEDLALLQSGVCIRIKALKDIFLKKAINVVQDAITNIDLTNRQIALEHEAPIRYDYLVIALGSVSNDFGIPGLREHSVSLKELPDALRIHLEIQRLIKQAQRTHRPAQIIIGGGGVSGVETAGELRHYGLHLAQRQGFDPNLIQVRIIEASPTILTGLDPWVQSAARQRLGSLGVMTMTGQPIVHVDERSLQLKDGQSVPFDMFIWSGGIKANDLILGLKVACAGKQQICVNDFLQLPGDPHVYAVGDAAYVMDASTKRPVPQVVPMAVAEGRLVAANIFKQIHSQAPMAYRPKHSGYVFPVGGRWAVSTIGGWRLSGLAGWIVRKLVDLEYFLSILSLPNALKVFWQGGRMYLQND